MIRYLQRLKKILQSSYFYVILFIILLLLFLFYLFFDNKDSIYSDGNKRIIGYVVDYKEQNDKLTIELGSDEKLIVKYYEDLDIDYGDYIEVEGVMYRPKNNTIPNCFNYKKYLNNKDIFYIMKANYMRVISETRNPLFIIKKFLVKRIDRIDKTGYIRALVLGDKSYLDNYSVYQKIGVSHLFAISGMHVTLLMTIFLRIFKRFRFKYILLDLLLICYGFIILFPSSIKRALLFLFFKQFNSKYSLNLTNIRILFLTAFFLLVFNIKTIYDPSFVYSFTCVFGLLYSDSRVYIRNRFLRVFKSTVIVALFTLPLSLYFNYEYNFLSILYNVFLIPFVSFLVYPLSLVSVLLSFLYPLFELFINTLQFLCNVFSRWNFLTLNMSFSIGKLLIYYFLLFLFLNKSRFFFLGIIVFFLAVKISVKFDSSYRVYFFDVGQGDSSLLISPFGGDAVLIDTGGNATNMDYHVSDDIISFLKSISITKLESLVLTHGDFDHMGEAINLVNNFKVDKVIFDCGEYNDLEKELIKVLDKKHIKYYSCIKELNIDKNKLYFLQTKEYDNENDNSNVIYTEFNGYKFMFMGDAGFTTEKEILDKYNLPDIDVLKVGHHGSKTSSSKEFIDEINPKYSIISVGKNNRYGHPNKETLNNLTNSKIYRSDQDGSVMFKIKNDKLNIETCSP